ncbi:MAG TPA: FHA domain-containing protein [Roseiflexaceae bacterium]|nr:FHA domain-containing protein [Roseiflexaceae bacterium]
MFGRLYIEEGERPARMIELAGAVTIGRTADNDIVLESDGVSHYHAMLMPQPDGVTLFDLGSTFGTFVDAVQALPDEPMRLPNGARITIGRAQLRYAAPQPRPAASNGRAPNTGAPRIPPRLLIPSLNTRFEGIGPHEPFPTERRVTLLIWVGAPLAGDHRQSSRSLRWNGDLPATLELRVRVRAASPAWEIVAEEPIVQVKPWGSARIARYHLLARRPDRSKLAINVELADTHSLVQHVLLGVNAEAHNGSQPAGALPHESAAAATLCRTCGAILRASAKYCTVCGSPR